MRATRWCAALVVMMMSDANEYALREASTVYRVRGTTNQYLLIVEAMAPGSGGDYDKLPWRLDLLTQTNSRC